MKKGHSKSEGTPGFPPKTTEKAPWLGESYSSLLIDFPDPILLVDGQKKVVFLNRVAVKLFGETLRVGDLCPICPLIAGWENKGEDPGRLGRCLRHGENLNRVPVLIKTRGGINIPFTVTATPIRGQGDQPGGCVVMLRDLHEDLLASPDIQLQMATLTSIQEHFPMPFFMVDPDLRLTFINERMEKLTGYTRNEVVGKTTCDFMLNTIQCKTEDCPLRQVMKERKPISGLRRVVRDRQGREVPVVVAASIITDVAGRVIGGFEAIRDITPIVEAEKKIQLLTELTHEGILMADENQRIVFANSRMAEIAGRPKEDLIGLGLWDVLSPQHSKMVAELSRMTEQDRQQDLQFCSTLDQSPGDQGAGRVYETCMAVSQLGEKTLSCIYLRDLTNRIRGERELHKAITFLNNIIHCSVDGIVVVDTKGNPLVFNEGAERILGYKAEEIIGHPEVFRQFYPLEVATEMMRRMRSDDFGPRDKLNTTQISFIHKNGEEVPVHFSASIIRERGQEVGSVGIFSDLRERLKMRRELEESRAQLLQSEKIASLGRLAAGVAHEINNPLAGILIYTEMLQREMPKEAPGWENLEVIVSQTVRCQQIVTRLLEFSRQSLGQKTLFDVNEIIHRCVELINHQVLFHNIEIHRDLDPQLPQILGNPGQLQQVFTNLLLNAADAVRGQGRITITSRPDPQVEGVVLTFTDTGVGIPPDIREKIFEPFFTTKAPGKGTGLGLSIAYGVIQRHGGTIEVASPEGGGTTFTIRLPLDSPEKVEQFELA